MKKSICSALVISLLIGSCSKDDSSLQNTQEKNQKVEIGGQLYEIEFLKEKISILTGIDKERLIFDPTKKIFSDTKYDYKFNLSEYIESIHAITNDL